MKIHLGAAMPLKGGRPAIAAVEVLERRDSTTGRMLASYNVGDVERIVPYSVEATRSRVLEMIEPVKEHKPCVFVDVGSPQGLALYKITRTDYPRGLHKPHAFPGVGMRPDLFSTFLQAYSGGRVSFEPGLDHRQALDRALVFYMGGGVEKTGVELSSEDEALVVALGLSMMWPKHGPDARSFEEA